MCFSQFSDEMQDYKSTHGFEHEREHCLDIFRANAGDIFNLDIPQDDDFGEVVRRRCPVNSFELLSSPVPNPQGPAPTQSNPVKISSKGTGADTKILWATTPPITFKHEGGL